MNTKNLLRECYEAFEQQDLQRLLALWSEDCELVDVPSGTTMRGVSALGGFLQYLYEGLPNVRVENLRIISEDDAAAVQFDLVAKHGGTLFDRPASNNDVRWQLVSVFDIDPRRRLIRREAYYYDRPRLFEQLEGGV